MKILAIDPGQFESGFVVVVYSFENKQFFISEAGKTVNSAVINAVETATVLEMVIVERPQSFGQTWGESLIETAMIVGEIRHAARHRGNGVSIYYLTRKQVTGQLCGSAKSGDPGVRAALIEALGPPGTKREPGPTWGVKTDAWQALGLCVAWLEKNRDEFLEDGKRNPAFTCVCFATDRLTGKRLESEITWANVVANGWAKPKGQKQIPSKWVTMTRQMFRYRSASWWARTFDPGATMGLSFHDEAEDATAENESAGLRQPRRRSEVKAASDAESVKAQAEILIEPSTERNPSPEREAEPVPRAAGGASPDQPVLPLDEGAEGVEGDDGPEIEETKAEIIEDDGPADEKTQLAQMLVDAEAGVLREIEKALGENFDRVDALARFYASAKLTWDADDLLDMAENAIEDCVKVAIEEIKAL